MCDVQTFAGLQGSININLILTTMKATIDQYKIVYVSRELKIRNASWCLVMLNSYKYAIFMNGKLQRIFKRLADAETWFEIYTSK